MVRGIISFSLIICSLLSAGCAGNIPVAPVITRQDSTNLQTASVPEIAQSPPSETRIPRETSAEEAPEPMKAKPAPPPRSLGIPERVKKYIKNYLPPKKRKI